MKYLIFVLSALLFGCSHYENKPTLPKVSNIELLPDSSSAHYLAWERNGDLLWLTTDLNLLKETKLDVYAIQQVFLLDDGILLITDTLQNDEITEQLIKLSFSGQIITTWPRLPDSIVSLSIRDGSIYFLGYMGDEYRITEHEVLATGNNFGPHASVIYLKSKNKIICHEQDSQKPANCSKQGPLPWDKEGLWGTTPTLCSNYLLEDTFHQPNNNTKSWKYIIRDISTGNILGEIPSPNVSFARCFDNQLVTIGEEISMYSLPSTEPSSVQTCAGRTAQDAVIDDTGLVCVTETGDIIKLNH